MNIYHYWHYEINCENMNIVDLVIIEENNIERLKWPLAWVIKLFYVKDGVVRAAQLKTKDSALQRPVTKLCVLEEATWIRIFFVSFSIFLAFLIGNFFNNKKNIENKNLIEQQKHNLHSLVKACCTHHFFWYLLFWYFNSNSLVPLLFIVNVTIQTFLFYVY